jgi:hypothetical protein
MINGNMQAENVHKKTETCTVQYNKLQKTATASYRNGNNGHEPAEIRKMNTNSAKRRRGTYMQPEGTTASTVELEIVSLLHLIIPPGAAA